MMPPRQVVVIGSTGYLGSRLIPKLIERGHAVTAVVRSGSRARELTGCRIVHADPLDAASLTPHMQAGDTVVQLVGVPKPAPWKGPQFRAVDLVAGLASIDAARAAQVGHFVYVSVARPAPIMKDYLAVRRECEERLEASGLCATILRPWYILGPGHWWPLALQPVYRLMERFPATHDAAVRLGLVTLHEMLTALVWVIEHPPASRCVIEVPEIRRLGGLS
ncbi:MAG: NAD(P)H-binding protein [Nitrospira sp.]|nr:NAD(P)H-binding protein [Nitrospira sp.]